MVYTHTLEVATEGNCHLVDITERVQQAVGQSGLANGIVTVFNIGSTGGVTTIEYEPGLVRHDMKAAFEKLAPADGVYEHEKTWHDDNGHAHVRASLLGASLTVPFCQGVLTLGTWQQITLIDFDTRPRKRKVVCQVIGE